MQHEDADQTHAVERYLLGDMTRSEVAQFEEHVFICPECAESVKMGAIFVENTRAVFKEEAAQGVAERAHETLKSRPAPWWSRFMFPLLVPAIAMLALICTAGYQQLVVIRGLRSQLAEVAAPQVLPSSALHAASRGDPPTIVVPANAHFFSVYFDVAVASASGYSCAIQDGSGSIKFTEHLPPRRAEAGGTINLLIGRSVLPEGDYIMIVSAESPRRVEIGRYPFKVEFK